MSRLDRAVLDQMRGLLGGANPTPRRMGKLLDELADRRRTPVDQDDREAGRTPHRRVAPLDPEEAQRRLAERMEANQAMGLNPNAAPIEDVPGASALAVEGAEVPHIIPLGDSIPDDAEAIERLKATGLPRTRQVFEERERRVLQQMPVLRAAGRTLRTLEEAAEVLIAELQPNEQDEIRQCCQENDLANWVVILGSVSRMAALKELHAGEFDPDWRNRGSGGAGKATAREEVCEMCGGLIPPDPIRRGRRFCCSRHGSEQVAHSEGCALASRQMVKGAWVTVGA